MSYKVGFKKVDIGLIQKNIMRQKQKINNSKKYSDVEKVLIMKGLDMAYDRVHSIDVEGHLL